MSEESSPTNPDAPQAAATEDQSGETLEGGAYEVLRKRLSTLNRSLLKKLEQLNVRRKDVFGGQELAILGNARIKTENNCVPRDIIGVGSHLIFGYNVFIGLKSETAVSDVFSVHRFDGVDLHLPDADVLGDPNFLRDFSELYKYYKNARFLQFIKSPGRLLMIFQVGETVGDRKMFRFKLHRDHTLEYVDDRGDLEYTPPPQHDFEWESPSRDDHVAGMYPHISIRDIVFVECVGGDLTIKVENNTESGDGIYEEAVENPDQTLDDAYIRYALVDGLVLLKIRPYRENVTRYLVFNPKDQTVTRIDSIGEACIKLPEGHGLIFPKGYFLHGGGARQFDEDVAGMLYHDCVRSPNGEDFLYIFYHREHGRHILIRYNLISKEISNPIICHGYSHYDDGKMMMFTAENDDPRRVHPMQIWQTPFYADSFEIEHKTDSFLTKIGNRDLVRGISEGYAISRLAGSERVTLVIYQDLIQSCTNMIDGYHWLDHDEVFNLQSLVKEMKTAASAAIDEYEKVVRIRENTATRITESVASVKRCRLDYATDRLLTIDNFVTALSEVRTLRGHVISLRELRYADLALINDLDKQLEVMNQDISVACVDFLMRDDALAPYEVRNREIEAGIDSIHKIADLKPQAESLETLAAQLDLLTDVINNLNIDDATKTTEIVDKITDIYAGVNRTRALVRNARTELGKSEAKAEFAAQYKLLSQSISNYIGMCDTTTKCDEFLTKVMIHIEELEGRFADFEDYVMQLHEKREEAYTAFSSRKQILDDEKKRRIGSLASSANRILKGAVNRAETFKSVDEVNAYFASDLMVSKLRGIVETLHDMGDSVKADDLSGQIKTAKDEIVRRLRDKLELFDEGDNVIKLGDYRFTVNTQPLELTTVMRDGDMAFHLNGTDFYEAINDPEFLETRNLWTQELVSENQEVFRGEFLAYQILMAAENNDKNLTNESLKTLAVNDAKLLECVQHFCADRYDEGYEKGVHDHDAARILKALVTLLHEAQLLRYDSVSRAHAILFWCYSPDGPAKERLRSKLRSIGALPAVFGYTDTYPPYVEEIREAMAAFFTDLGRIPDATILTNASEYLYHELQDASDLEITISQETKTLRERFTTYLKDKTVYRKFTDDIRAMASDLKNTLSLVHDWVAAYVRTCENDDAAFLIDEVVTLIVAGDRFVVDTTSVVTSATVTDLLGRHPRIEGSSMPMHLDRFLLRLKTYCEVQVPLYRRFIHMRTAFIENRRESMRLSEFQPRVMGSFVRNKLINDVYLNLVGANFAKQMGAAGENKRTDLMGLLLLISPPGYGKTTLMEYMANRLGLTFMKINGPAIGHKVTSLDPAEAPNATARVELDKLNLSLEMGNNVMIYLDDIQHVNPEFLQKFISLCDAQRKIEGVYRGVTRTYDLRGKKVAVVMAGNPYTESGDTFQIPDMLSNRADTYNLGDISTSAADVFAMSFIENAMTSNPVLNKISSHGHDDVYRFLDAVDRGSADGITFDYGYSVAEVDEILNVLRKLCKVRDVVLEVNRQYIYSAAQQDDYRTEPPFKLQGSYRNMNRMAEKVFPVMTDAEVEQIITDHYYNEAQTLTAGAESNILKFREITGKLADNDLARWNEIKGEFNRRQALSGIDDSDDLGKILAQLSGFTASVGKVRDVLDKGLNTGLKNVLEAVAMRSAAAATDRPDITPLIDAVKALAPTPESTAATSPNDNATAIAARQTEILESIAGILEELKDNSETNVRLRDLIEQLMKGSLVVDLKD